MPSLFPLFIISLALGPMALLASPAPLYSENGDEDCKEGCVMEQEGAASDSRRPFFSHSPSSEHEVERREAYSWPGQNEDAFFDQLTK